MFGCQPNYNSHILRFGCLAGEVLLAGLRGLTATMSDYPSTRPRSTTLLASTVCINHLVSLSLSALCRILQHCERVNRSRMKIASFSTLYKVSDSGVRLFESRQRGPYGPKHGDFARVSLVVKFERGDCTSIISLLPRCCQISQGFETRYVVRCV